MEEDGTCPAARRRRAAVRYPYQDVAHGSEPDPSTGSAKRKPMIFRTENTRGPRNVLMEVAGGTRVLATRFSVRRLLDQR